MKIRQIDIKGERYGVEAFINPIPTGAVFPFAGITAPEGFLFCDGSAVSRTTYSKLLGVIGETYGSGDGLTTFNLPDYRETVLVGAGQNAKLDIKAHDVYELGQFKDDQIQGHRHDSGSTLYSGNTGNRAFSNVPGDNSIRYTKGVKSQSEYGIARVGTTTHGKQIGINFIIKV